MANITFEKLNPEATYPVLSLNGIGYNIYSDRDYSVDDISKIGKISTGIKVVLPHGYYVYVKPFTHKDYEFENYMILDEESDGEIYIRCSEINHYKIKYYKKFYLGETIPKDTLIGKIIFSRYQLPNIDIQVSKK